MAEPTGEVVDQAWSIGEALIVLGTVLMAGPFVIALLFLEVLSVPTAGDEVWFWVIVTLIYYGLPGLAILMLASRKSQPLGASVLALWIVTAFNMADSVFMTAVGLGPPETSMQVMDELVSSFGAGPARILVTLALLVLVAPLVEEAVFRGVALSGLLERFGPATAIGMTAVLFSAIHLDLWRFVPLVFLGVVLGYLAWHARSIWPAVLAHALVNGFAYLIALILAGT